MKEDADEHNRGFHPMSLTVPWSRAFQTCNFIFAWEGYNNNTCQDLDAILCEINLLLSP